MFSQNNKFSSFCFISSFECGLCWCECDCDSKTKITTLVEGKEGRTTRRAWWDDCSFLLVCLRLNKMWFQCLLIFLMFYAVWASVLLSWPSKQLSSSYSFWIMLFWCLESKNFSFDLSEISTSVNIMSLIFFLSSVMAIFG